MKALKILCMVAVVAAVCFLPTFAAQAQTATTPNWSVGLGAGLGAAFTIIGAASGIGLIASRAVESMARQPEVAGNINGAMIISAALIEGVSFFSLIVCILILVLE